MANNDKEMGYEKPIRANDDDSTTTFTAKSDFDATKPNSDGGPEVTPTRHLMEEALSVFSPRRSAFDHDGNGKEGGSAKRAATKKDD